jgi:signal transduction histidine kinase
MSHAQQSLAGITPKLAHDLRTPLNQVIGYSELLIEQAQEEGQESFVPDLQKIHEAGRALLALISQLQGAPEQSIAAASEISTTTTAKSTPRLEALSSGVAQGLLLVVDDNAANRDVLTKRLKRQGYEVAAAESGAQALDILHQRKFDLILLDIVMPELDGFQVLKALKADDAFRHIPVIMISGLDEMDSVARCIQLGAEDFLCKPFDPILLKARIGACLEKKRGRDREVRLFEELQQNYAKLQRLEAQRDDLANMIVHDLRTPLTSVIAGMQTLEGMGGLNELQGEMVGIAIDAGENLLNLIGDLLDVEKLESGTMQPDNKSLVPGVLVDAALAQVASLAKARELNLVRDVPDDLPSFQGDEDTLRRTLVNLLGNAIKFTPIGGTITLSAALTEEEESIRFAVLDTGEGIPAKSFERIFEKFGQVESHKGRRRGTGLGLTFCKLAVGAHGGTIGVQSELGAGSTFSFTIPLSAA